MSARGTPPSSSSSSSLPTESSQVSRMTTQEQQGEDDIERQENREGQPDATDEFPTIMMVPEKSRAAFKDSDRYYKPCHVSIGPHHRRHSSNLLREDEKWDLLYRLKAEVAIERPEVQDGEGAHDLDDEALIKEISEQMSRGPATGYFEDGSWSGTLEDLARNLLLDGYYLVAVYAPVVKTLQQHKNAHTPGSSHGQGQGQGQGGSPKTLRQISVKFLCSGICGSNEPQKEQEHTPGSDKQAANNNNLRVRDIWYILENQIPFFVLEEIFKRVTGFATAEAARKELTDYAHSLLDSQRMCISRDHPAAAKLLDETPQTTIFHLLHLLHKLLKPHYKPLSTAKSKKKKSNTGDRRGERQWHRATDYRKYANVEFKGRDLGDDDNKDSDVLSVLDVRIEGRNVVIPCLRVDGGTWTILLNLMALEGQHPRLLGTYVTAYCVFMSQIACTKEDVELLEAQGVIDRHLSTPESVAAELSKLCYGVVFDKNDPTANYLKPLWQHLDRRYTSRQQNILAWLRLNYLTCRNVSVLLGVFSAFILLGAGVLSAVYQVLSYYHGH